MIQRTLTCSALLAATALIAACSTPEPPPPKKPKATRDYVAEIRGQAAGAPSVIQVMPLADTEVDDLRREARRKEEAKDFAGAASALKRALTLRPDDPLLLQWLAELSLQQGAFQVAEQYAQKSYDLGPRLGEICVRNWLTIQITRTERGDATGASSAKAQVPTCQIAEKVRM
ncbi:MAG TPA: tetratricopeptide repeat protein [Xanthomonadales bacterium]|nr:tetratricopeptide repeat protein [Xanthomonadales bacterium]